MKKLLLAVGALGAMVFAAACSSGGGGGAHGTLSSGTYSITNASIGSDTCGLIGTDPTALDTTGNTIVVSGNTLTFNGGLVLAGGPPTWVYSTSDVFAFSASCSATLAQSVKISANGTDVGKISENFNLTQNSGSTDCSAAPVPVPCKSSAAATLTKTGP